MSNRIVYVINERAQQPEEGLRLDVRILDEPLAYAAGAWVMPDAHIHVVTNSRHTPPMASFKAAIRAYLEDEEKVRRAAREHLTDGEQENTDD